MSITWADFLSDLRNDLDDTADTPRWSDEQFYVYTKDAVRDYSQYFPKRVDGAELSLAGSAYTLPADYVDTITVECPEDRFLEDREERPGIRYIDKSKPLFYYIEGGSLYLQGTPLDGEAVYITYYALHDIPTSEADNSFIFTVPDRDIELLRIYVKAKIFERQRGKQSRLDSYKPGSGRRDDNPLAPEINTLMMDYQEKIAARIPGGAVRLYRPGRMR